jgi:hypothetical protein
MCSKEKYDNLELLDVSLLDSEWLSFVEYWLKVFGAQVGWHYYLDLIWQLKKIQSLELPKGATILDAGAGNGMSQFLMAACGYNVISVDFSNRSKPFLISKVFCIKDNQSKKDISNEYTEHLNRLGKFSKKDYLSRFKSMAIRVINLKFWKQFFLSKFFVTIQHKKNERG